jgi:hypothetical protein
MSSVCLGMVSRPFFSKWRLSLSTLTRNPRKIQGGVSALQIINIRDPDGTKQESPIFQLQVTFAALQESTQSVFNPAKLVESLQLRTTEQQDAQESVFSSPSLINIV